MTAREKKLLWALVLVAIAVFFSLFIISTHDRIDKARASISKYRTAIASLPNEGIDEDELQLEIATLREKATRAESQDDLGQAEIATLVKDSLAMHGIEPQRIQTGKSGGMETINFLLECGSLAFFSFLRELPSPGHRWRYDLVSVKALPSGEAISVTLRLSHE